MIHTIYKKDGSLVRTEDYKSDQIWELDNSTHTYYLSFPYTVTVTVPQINQKKIDRFFMFDHMAPVQQEIYDNSKGNLLKRVSYNYKGFIDSLRKSSSIKVQKKKIEFPDVATAETWFYDYDSAGNTIEIIDPFGTTTYMEYANVNNNNPNFGPDYQSYYFGSASVNINVPKNRLLTKATLITDSIHKTSQLNQTHYEYDYKGNLYKEAVAYNGSFLITQYDCDIYGNVIVKTDPKLNVLKYEYGSAYNYAYLTKITNGNNVTLDTYLYDFNIGKPTIITDPNNNTFSVSYDSIGRETDRTLNNSDPNKILTKSIYYDDIGSMVDIWYGNYKIDEHIIDIFYDPVFGKPIEIMKGGLKKTFGYDAEGRLAWEQDNLGLKTLYQYDVLGRLIQTTYPDNSSSTTYFSNWTSSTYTAIKNDAKGNSRYEFYDSLERLTMVWEFPGNVKGNRFATNYVYDSASHLIQSTNPKGAKTINTYDNLGRLTRIDYPQDGTKPIQSETFEYDDVGNLHIKKIEGTTNSKTIDYEFFAGYRVQKITTQPDGKVVNYTYDNNDNILTQSWSSNAGSGSYSYTNYDPLNHAHNVTVSLDTNSFAFGYDYDFFGRIKNITYPERTQTVDYNWDSLDRLVQISGFINSCTYDGDSNLKTMTYANNITTTKNYRTIDERLESIQVGSSLMILTYDYDLIGNIQSLQTNTAGIITNEYYQYDGLNRLNWAGDRTFDQKASATGTQWSYDEAGNMTEIQKLVNGTTQEDLVLGYDLANRLWSRGTTNYTNDEFGNRTIKNAGSITSNYSYDSEQRLIQVS
jgi:Rhs family protein